MIKKRATKGAEAIALITEIYATLLTKLLALIRSMSNDLMKEALWRQHHETYFWKPPYRT